MFFGWMAVLSPEPAGYLGRKPRRSPERMRAWFFGISLPLGFVCQWASRLITVDDKEKEAQYACCTFQTRHPGKNQAPVELAPAYKNKWTNRWTTYWFYAPIAVVGPNLKQEEVITYDLVSRMVDLEVELSSELTKASRSSASTCAFYQATRVITTRDAFEEFVAADIWPCQPRWGPWAFKT
jgi:hypothetical protein